MHASRQSHHGKPCPYCRRQMNLHDARLRPTWDHVTPRCRGGREKIVCCSTCNGIKADMLPDQWASYMAANPGWWMLTRAERRARARAPREATRLAKWGPRRPLRQGSPPASPVVVPPEYIWPPRPSVLPIADTRYILTHGNRAFRAMERRRALTPELIAATIEQDAKLRWSSDGR